MNFSELDQAITTAFANFLSWGLIAGARDQPCPPAVWAYMWGVTLWCPPKGEL